jgi:hypothetical protein
MADTQRIAGMLGKAGWAYDVSDFDWLTGIFTEDAQFTLTIEGMGQVLDIETREAIGDLFTSSAADQTDQRRHLVTNIFFEDETDSSVTAMSMLTLISIENGELTVISSGVYNDKIVLDGDGEWRIKHRDLYLDRPY